MGDAQRLSPDEQIRFAREQFESAEDFTVAVEEEFAVLDPETLSMVNRFEELQAAAQGTAVEEHLVGELISSEVEVRTGRCETFAEAAEPPIRGAPGRTSGSSTRPTTGEMTRSSATSSGATTASASTSTSASAASTA